MTEDENIQIVIHGRGGQGCVTACEIIAESAYLSGNFVDVHAYPSFGAERRGAPVQAYAKLSRDKQIWDRSEIRHPDIVIVFDESVLDEEIASSLKENGIIIINSSKNPAHFRNLFNLVKTIKVITADIDQLSMEEKLLKDGQPVINTAILGLLAKGLPDLSIENIKKVVTRQMSGEWANKNIKLIDEGYDLAKMV
ncbi:MAG: 2-oxoacid:acceptor oxidoreductase family protein [Promethearchaeia archaeon]